MESKSVREYVMDIMVTLIFIGVGVVVAGGIIISVAQLIMGMLQTSSFGQFINI